MFIEAFIVFAVVWTFGSVLNETGKRELDFVLKQRIEPNKTDFITF